MISKKKSGTEGWHNGGQINLSAEESNASFSMVNLWEGKVVNLSACYSPPSFLFLKEINKDFKIIENYNFSLAKTNIASNGTLLPKLKLENLGMF